GSVPFGGWTNRSRNWTTEGWFQSADPTTLAAILPSGASRNVAGVPSVRKTRGTPWGAIRKTSTRPPRRGVRARKLFTSSAASSVEAQTNDTSASFGLDARASIEGSSARHGGHHVAQMFRKTALPR